MDVRDRDTNASLGKMKISEFVRFLKNQLPKVSEAREKLMSQAFYDDEVEVVSNVSLEVLNETLERNTFIAGHEASAEDWRVFKAITSVDRAKYPHIARWFGHLKSIS